MKKLLLGIVAMAVLTGCGGGMFSFDPTGNYVGSFTATVGNTGTVAMTASIIRGDGALTGLVADLTASGDTIRLLCNDVFMRQLDCYILDARNRHVFFEGRVTTERWSGDWKFTEDLDGENIIVGGTFVLNRQ